MIPLGCFLLPLVGIPGSWAEAVMIDLQWLAIFLYFQGMYDWSLVQCFQYVSNDPNGCWTSVMTVCSPPFANIVTYWAMSPGLSSYGGVSLLRCVWHNF